MASKLDRQNRGSSDRASYWRSVIAECSKSGLSQRAYCERHGLANGTLSWWKHHLRTASRRTKRGSTAVTESRFAEVQVREDAISGSAASFSAVSVAPLEVVVAGDLVVRVHGDCDESLLLRVITALRRTGC